MRRRIQRLEVLLASACLCLLCAVSAAAQETATNQERQCWTDTQLRVTSGEPIVRRGLFAYRAPPDDVELTKGMRIGRYYRRAIRRFRILNSEKLVALTFDIGEQPHEISGYQGRIFDHLREEGVRATLFLGGKWMVTHPERTQQLIADPLFEVANHAWEHRNLRLLNAQEQQRAIMRAQSVYHQQWKALKGRRCRFGNGEKYAHENALAQMNLFRFPFGACRDDSLQLAGDAGLQSIQWDISSSDPWKGQTVARMVRAVVPRVKPGSIVLFHANGRGWHTDASIPEIVTQLRARGYRFVTIGDLLAMSERGEAEPVLTKTCYDARPGDTNRYDGLSKKLHAKYERFLRSARARKAANVSGEPRTPSNSERRSEPSAARKTPQSKPPEREVHDAFERPN